MTHADPPHDSPFDYDPFTDHANDSVPSPEGGGPLSARQRPGEARQHSSRRRAASAWLVSQATAEGMIDKAGAKFSRAARRLTNARPRALAGLGPLVFYAAENLGNTRPSTVLGLVYTLEADDADRTIVDETGAVAPNSTLYRVLDFLMSHSEEGLPEPEERLRAFLSDEGLKSLWSVLRAAAGGRPLGSAPNGDNEHSSLNFEVPAVDVPDRSVGEVLADIESLTGLAPVKEILREFAALEQANAMRREAGLRPVSQSRHLLFLGNPGTGKTTVARIVADLLKACGTLPDARLVEVDRSMLVGEWLGSSALKTRKAADAALGGVLFIDEAYSLAGADGQGVGDRFAQEALDTLVKVMEDDRDDLVVILAGYPEPMERLLRMNPGLASRIGLTVDFPDYGLNDLLAIFRAMADEAEYEVDDDALVAVECAVSLAAHDERFGNARFVRSLLEGSIRAHALRVMSGLGSADGPIARELVTLRLADTVRAAGALSAVGRLTPGTGLER